MKKIPLFWIFFFGGINPTSPTSPNSEKKHLWDLCDIPCPIPFYGAPMHINTLKRKHWLAHKQLWLFCLHKIPNPILRFLPESPSIETGETNVTCATRTDEWLPWMSSEAETRRICKLAANMFEELLRTVHDMKGLEEGTKYQFFFLFFPWTLNLLRIC